MKRLVALAAAILVASPAGAQTFSNPPQSSVVQPAPYNFYDSFGGTPANVGGRTPDKISNGNNWQVTGVDAAVYTAGNNKLQNIGGSNVAYAIMHTTCTGPPQEVGATYVTSGTSSSQPTIASLLSYSTYPTLPYPMVHPLVQASSGTTTITTTVWDSVSRPGGSNISGQLSQFYNSNPGSVANAAGTAYNYRVFINGNFVTTRVELASTGAVLIQQTSSDPLTISVDGPDVFFELGPDSSYFTNAYARCAAPTTNNQTQADFPGGVVGSVIGTATGSSYGNFGALAVGGATPNNTTGNFTDLWNPSSIGSPSFIANGAGDGYLTILHQTSGNNVGLIINGSGCSTKLNEDGSFNMNLFGCNASKAAISMAANDGAVTVNDPLTIASGNSLKLASTLLVATAPTITSGFSSTGTTISNSNGAASFTITIGSTPGSTGVIALPTASHGWSCKASDITTHSVAVSQTVQTATGAASATFTQYSDVMVATAWVAGDILQVNCMGY